MLIIKYKLWLTNVKILVEECDTFAQLIQIKVWLDVCYLDVHLHNKQQYKRLQL